MRNLPSDLCERLAADREPSVREDAATWIDPDPPGSRALSKETLLRLAGERNPDISSRLAERPTLEEEVLLLVSEACEAFYVVRRPELLSADVQRIVWRRTAAMARGDEKARVDLLSRPEVLPVLVLEALSSVSAKVRAAAADRVGRLSSHEILDGIHAIRPDLKEAAARRVESLLG